MQGRATTSPPTLRSSAIKTVKDSFYSAGTGKKLEHSLILRGGRDTKSKSWVKERKPDLSCPNKQAQLSSNLCTERGRNSAGRARLPNAVIHQRAGRALRMALSGGRLARTQGGPRMWRLLSSESKSRSGNAQGYATEW